MATFYHFSKATGKREVCVAPQNCKYGGDRTESKKPVIEELTEYAVKGDVKGFLKAKETQTNLQKASEPVSIKQVLADFPNELRTYATEDEQEFFDDRRSAHKTISINGGEFSLAPASKGGSYCTDCFKFLPRGALSGSRADSVDCPHCGENVKAVFAGVGIESNSWQFLYPEKTRAARWFHTSSYPNWDEALAAAPDDATPLVHLGTRESAMDRKIDIEEHPFGQYAADFGGPVYIYEIELDEDVEIAEDIMQDDGYTHAPSSTADAGDERFEKYSARGVTRYLNFFEDHGSISLLANPKKFKVVNKQKL